MKRSSDGRGSGPRPPGPLTVVRGGPPELGTWWTKRKNQPLAEVIEGVSLAKAMSDVGVLALAHLARRLCNAETPEHVKDKIALTIGPKLAVQIDVLTREDGDTTSDLLGAYSEARDRLDS